MVEKQYGFLVDPEKCIFCRGCVAACKLENHVGFSWQRSEVILMGPDLAKAPPMYPVYMNCQHCEFPACIAACPVEGKAIEKREKDGRVLVKPEMCDGDEFCVHACPYGATRLTPNKNSKTYYVVDKCTYCVHKADRSVSDPGGNQPACVTKCPTGAIRFGITEEFEALAEEDERELMDVDLNFTGPSNVFLKPRGDTEEEEE